MGFKEVRRRVIECLRSDLYQFEEREVAEGKNLLQTGEITPDELVALLNRCRGDQFETSPHHFDRSQMIHIFKPSQQAVRWYIKVYFVDESTIFISVHPS